MELWLHAFSFPHRVAQLARQAEEWGFTGMLLADSQNLNADVWVELALAAAATSRLRLGPGVTNSVTRHLAVTASAAATLQAETAGRAVLALGRGDSAVAQIGRRSVSAAELEVALRALQSYLRGEEAQVDGTPNAIRWLPDQRFPKVPVWVAATGPRTIAAAARVADGVDFSVGAEPERLRWAIDVARRASGGELSLGAYVNVAVDPDIRAARELVRGSVSIFARFAAEAPPPKTMSESTRQTIARLRDAYESTRHGEIEAPAAQRLDDDFIDRFALVGPAAGIAERLRAIRSLGIDRVIVVPGSLDADPAAVQASNRLFASDVLPLLGERH
ncbi:MAG: LLM class flavin-dependent oxidoreductase [Solirubrobacterales bacterium]|nr:LLM class flavin-dependent oxidoreductase [Solirubrobacterales bacterium]